MNINSENLLESILESLSRIDYIHAEDIPNIDLYMDHNIDGFRTFFFQTI